MGILNSFLNSVGLSGLTRSWTGDTKTALACIAVTLIWQAAGYYMVMYVAAMDGISAEIYESAVIDGANAADKLFRITLPLIKNIIGITWVFEPFGHPGIKLYSGEDHDRRRTKRGVQCYFTVYL